MSKQHFASAEQHTSQMTKIPINEVLATNLVYFMKDKGFNQSSLHRKTKVAQRTIGNYMKPALRAASKTGKQPSAKLAEVESIAEGLGVEVWELLRPLKPAERVFYKQIEDSFAKLRQIAPELERDDRQKAESN